MSLQLILGNSGSGKSRWLYEQIIAASMQLPEMNFLVIVPEQFTMQTQRELVHLHPKHGILNIDILSFQRLAHRIFEEVGADRRTVLEEIGKTLLLRRAAEKHRDELVVLKGNLKKRGYLAQVKSLISEFTQYDIDQEKMEKMLEAAGERPRLQRKLQDIRILYEAFQEELAGQYITAEETLDALCQVADQSRILKNSVIALDGFTGFTPIQVRLLKKLMVLAREIRVTVTVDGREDFYRIRGAHELFYLSKKTVHTLTALAGETGCEILPPVILGAGRETLPRFVSSRELAFLERHLFRGGRYEGIPQYRQKSTDEKKMGYVTADAQPESTRGKEQGRMPADTQSGKSRKNTPAMRDITLHETASPISECRYLGRTIRSLVQQGYRYHEMAVIVGNPQSYSDCLPYIMEEYDIPVFMDQRRTVFANPYIEFLRSALDLLQQDYRAVSVFRYLRTNLCGLKPEEIDLLENYVIAAGIRGKKAWSEPFTRCPESISQSQLQVCETMRRQIMEPLERAGKILRSAKSDAREKTKALYELTCHYEIQNQLAAWEKRFRDQGQPELQKEYSQVYALVMGLFDKMADLLGDERMSLREYTELLETGFEEMRVGLIPPATDQVQVGDLKRTRLKDIRVLFFLGLNDGWVPASSQGGGLLSDMERELLTERAVELAPTAREDSYIQRYYLYLNLTKPSEKLFLSYCKCSQEGAAMRPSYVVRSLMRLFPSLRAQNEEETGSILGKAVTPKTGLRYLTEGLQQVRTLPPTGEWLELYSWYRSRENWREQADQLVRAAFLTFHDRGIGKQAARELYGEMLHNSVSRLEKFASCAFSHFLQYGLQLQERETYTFEPVDLGTVAHKVVEVFSREADRREGGWDALTREDRDRLTDICVKEVTREYGQQILHSSARNEQMIERIRRILKRTVWALQLQLTAGKFRPEDYEVPFTQEEILDEANQAISDSAAESEATAEQSPANERSRVEETQSADETADPTGERRMQIQGRIDRIDVCEEDGRVLVKVIDYKSGSRTFDLNALYQGLQLQLMVYLNAAMRLEQKMHPDKEIVPAGIFYYQIRDPLIESDRELPPDQLEQLLLRDLRPNGLINADPEVYEQMDTQISGTSDVIPLTVKKDGSPDARSRTASEEQFLELTAFVQKKMRKLGARILDGEIGAEPCERGQKRPCEYCIYREVCRLDEKLPGTRVNRLRNYPEEELWERISRDAKSADK